MHVITAGIIVFVKIKKNKKNGAMCLICKLPMTFSDFERDLDKNMFDLEFLNQYQAKLYFHLNQLFNEKKVPSAASSTKSTSIKRGIG